MLWLYGPEVSEAFEKWAPGVSHKLLYELLVARYRLSLACDQAVMSWVRARANEAGEGPGRRIEILSFVHRGQTSEHAREIARGSHRSIRKTLHVAVTTVASSCEFEAK